MFNLFIPVRVPVIALLGRCVFPLVSLSLRVRLPGWLAFCVYVCRLLSVCLFVCVFMFLSAFLVGTCVSVSLAIWLSLPFPQCLFLPCMCARVHESVGGMLL